MSLSHVPNITYFKRFQMALDMLSPLPPVPDLPEGYEWVGWHDNLLATFAQVKLQCFRDEVDGIVFPNLSCLDGCERLMREIRSRPGFRPQSTWLIRCGDDDYCGTVQGVGDRYGCGGIQNLGIVAAHRGRGLGTALLLKALHGFSATGLNRATLEVTAQNEAAVKLYRRHGFRFRKTIYKMVETPAFHFGVGAAPPDWCL